MPVQSSRMDVDMVSQTLDHMIIRPKYGGTKFYSVPGVAVPARTKTYAVSISGKGVIYAIFAWVTSSGSQQNDFFGCEIDGEDSPVPTFKQLIDNYFVRPIGCKCALFCFDDVNYRYAGGEGFGVTFESSLKTYYEETHGRNPTVNLRLYYALISSS